MPDQVGAGLKPAPDTVFPRFLALQLSQVLKVFFGQISPF